MSRTRSGAVVGGHFYRFIVSLCAFHINNLNFLCDFQSIQTQLQGYVASLCWCQIVFVSLVGLHLTEVVDNTKIVVC